MQIACYAPPRDGKITVWFYNLSNLEVARVSLSEARDERYLRDIVNHMRWKFKENDEATRKEVQGARKDALRPDGPCRY
jgi:hypothetical protein